MTALDATAAFRRAIAARVTWTEPRFVRYAEQLGSDLDAAVVWDDEAVEDWASIQRDRAPTIAIVARPLPLVIATAPLANRHAGDGGPEVIIVDSLDASLLAAEPSALGEAFPTLESRLATPGDELRPSGFTALDLWFETI